MPPALPGFTVKNCADVEGNEGGVTRGSDTVLEAPAAATSTMSPSPEAPADVSALGLVVISAAVVAVAPSVSEAAAEVAAAAAAPARTGEDIGGKIQVSRRAVASGPVATVPLPPPSPLSFRIPCFDMVPTKVCYACGCFVGSSGRKISQLPHRYLHQHTQHVFTAILNRTYVLMPYHGCGAERSSSIRDLLPVRRRHAAS